MVLPPSVLSANPVNLFNHGGLSVFDGAGESRLQVQFRRQAIATEKPGRPMVGDWQACGRSAHRQPYPGWQFMSSPHCEQNLFMINRQFSLRRTIRVQPAVSWFDARRLFQSLASTASSSIGWTGVKHGNERA
jgi:hypothetical protein